jgi:glutathione-regulated potassium-efflux system ancillary protein KefG
MGGTHPVNNILILFAHPSFEKSRVNRALLAGIDKLPGVTLRDLYEHYPDFNVDVEREKELLTEHQVIVWHHPFYMYGAPALLKQWMDLVLEYGWAHGKGVYSLKDKVVFNPSRRAAPEAYTAADTTVLLSGISGPLRPDGPPLQNDLLPPFVVQGTHLLTGGTGYAASTALLERLARGV